MILTVPATWITISNGNLAGVKDEADGNKTWDWKQTEPLSTYLISAVAGEFVEKKDTWRGIPVRYVVPRGQEDPIEPTFSRTRQMLDLFSDKLGVPYPWAQYAQSSVNDFVEGGMENTSATTLTTRGLVDPAPRARTSPRFRRSRFSRTRASMVRRSGHLQRLGQSLAQRRLRHLFRTLLGRAALRRRRSRLRILARSSQLVPAEALVSGARSSRAISRIASNTPATFMTKADGC